MFVRFRRLPNGARRPPGIRNEAMFWTRGKASRRRLGSSHRRWVIGQEGREPYRIKVLLIENSRSDSKVKQEIVASLGGISAIWLESFYQGMTESVRNEHWELRSLRERTWFWEGVLERMAPIGDNRLNAEDRKRIRRAIHNVIPWVMEGERKRLELLEAQTNYESCKSSHETWQSLLDSEKETLERHLKKAEDARKNIPEYEAELALAAQDVFKAGLALGEFSDAG